MQEAAQGGEMLHKGLPRAVKLRREDAEETYSWFMTDCVYLSKRGAAGCDWSGVQTCLTSRA